MEDCKLLNRYSIIDTLNNDFYSSPGLSHGKMHAAIFFFHCARSSGNSCYEEIAGRLFDELFMRMPLRMPLGFANGLCGIGWGVEYLFQHGFVKGHTDKVLTRIDSCIISEISTQQMTELGLDYGILGLGYYISMRIRPSWKNGDTDATLELKENLIYLIDWLDRRLSDVGDAAADILEWLCELHDMGFYKTKVNRMMQFIETNNEKF